MKFLAWNCSFSLLSVAAVYRNYLALILFDTVVPHLIFASSFFYCLVLYINYICQKCFLHPAMFLSVNELFSRFLSNFDIKQGKDSRRSFNLPYELLS